MLTTNHDRDPSRQDQRQKAEQRLAELVRVGLDSREEPDDPAYWQKRRHALRRSIAKKLR